MITDAKKPRWADETHSNIQLDVKLENSAEYVSFVASPDDCTTHGPMLFNFAKNGLFGPVQDSDKERILRGELPVPEGYEIVDGQIVDTALAEQEATAELNSRLAALNTEEAKALAETDEDYAAQRKAKLIALLAVRQQEGWPVTVVWPE
jgi:hypothetical protein